MNIFDFWTKNVQVYFVNDNMLLQCDKGFVYLMDQNVLGGEICRSSSWSRV